MGETIEPEINSFTEILDQEVSESKIVVDLRRHGWRYARAFVIGFIVLQIAGLRTPGFYSDDPFILLTITRALDLALVYFTIVVPIGIVVYVLGRVFLLALQRRHLNMDLRLLLDFIITSALVITLLVNLGIFLSWTSAFLASPTYDIPILSLTENSIIVLSMFFLTLGVFYRFLSRSYLRIFSKPKLSLAYLRESGRMVDRAIGPILGLVTAAAMNTFTQLWILAIPFAIQLFTQYEKMQSEAELEDSDRNMFPEGEIREPIPHIVTLTPRQKFVYEQFRFSMKTLSRWIVLSVGIVTALYFISTSDAVFVLRLILGYPDYFYISMVNPFDYWSASLGVAIVSTGLFIVVYLFYKLRRIERPEGHVLSPRHRLEWLLDLGISAVAIALLVIYLLPQIGLDTWNSMRLELFWNRHYTYTLGYTPWSALVVATTLQVYISLILVGLILRIAGNTMGFLGKNEMTALKWQSRSGKVLLVGASLAIGNQILLTGDLYFGIISAGVALLGLTLLLVTMMFSHSRMQEIKWFDVGGEGS